MVRYIRGFVISRFTSIQCTIAGMRNIVRSTEDFVIERFVNSRFHCNGLLWTGFVNTAGTSIKRSAKGLGNLVRYIEVPFLTLHYYITGRKDIVRYNEDLVI